MSALARAVAGPCGCMEPAAVLTLVAEEPEPEELDELIEAILSQLDVLAPPDHEGEQRAWESSLLRMKSLPREKRSSERWGRR